MRQVLHGGLLAMCLQVDAEVEVYLDRRWQIATITRIVYDGDLARHVKVRLTPLLPHRSQSVIGADLIPQ